MTDDVASGGPPDGIAIEAASPDDRLDVLRVLDAAMLSVDADGLGDRIADRDVLVARFDRTGAVVGAVVLTRPEPDRRHVDAVAVRRARRGRGTGSALVAEAVRVAEADPGVGVVTAAFDPSLSGFYTGLGFEITSTGEQEGGSDGDGDERLWGRLDTTDPADRL
ncbi:GNAT family N-acetyltransferase [Halorubrum sp. JWXQ-INN 858]|uniref:GNAT family N-acetyltransferase n=1 Tax=Halorubrum sp. JWXQ-INN 858 TaxID=2690782 RepID=UPI002AA2A639|nr:GNAT family N-acetyltransferase [Halorubrum sp. JWXQ-INN 858]